ncbi:hypothetical protein K450DRAFT_218656 [Umbelopsis ramanniana AG]|uniref:Uncharacterized protein n=1 Tax=Umbelopsis ramanniana AG TaxID=1314678 RepID=A0AAD5HIZ9_UMBRA|nr:uncharacterized protein K450DRAFT_218656 [Umbelopsis ramanniana AG]KAI8584206.1 hypothetical protein K450DRAFT_218656 [Umbelopsis ramanniana AG]
MMEDVHFASVATSKRKPPNMYLYPLLHLEPPCYYLPRFYFFVGYTVRMIRI